MLICPQCELENPDNHKYCQKCGLSLTHKNCHQCGSQVSLTALQCHNCRAYTGQVWMAIIYYKTEANTDSIPEINVKKRSQKEFIAGANPPAKDSTELAAKIITEEFRSFLSCAM